MSPTREEQLQPVRHFDMHDDPLTYIETLHLLLWEEGLCITGYGLDRHVLTAKVYLFPRGDMHAIESVFINEPLVAGPQPVTHTWIADSRNMLIPQHLYHEQAAGEWLRQFHYVTPDENVYCSPVKYPTPLTVAYPVANELNAILNEYFPEGKIESLSTVLLQQVPPPDSDTADIVFLDKTTVLTIRKKGKLISHQIGETTDVNDLVYKIAAISQEHQIAQHELKVSLSGLCISDATAQELKCFFPKMVVPGSDQFSSFTLLSKLITCVL